MQFSKKYSKKTITNVEQVLSHHGREVSCYFLIGLAERALKTVSPPDLAPLNTEGATLPTFSAEQEKQQSEYFTLNEAERRGHLRLQICSLETVYPPG